MKNKVYKLQYCETKEAIFVTHYGQFNLFVADIEMGWNWTYTFYPYAFLVLQIENVCC